MRRACITVMAAATTVGAGGGTAVAKDIVYTGKTREGVSVRLVERAGKVRIIKAGLPVVCLSINRVGKSQSGGDPLHIKGNFPIGRKYRTSGFWRTALWWKEVTVNVQTDFRRTRTGLAGRLGETFGFIVPTFPFPQTVNYSCKGATRFTARKR